MGMLSPFAGFAGWRASLLNGMRITFLLPGAGRLPVGGLKVAYEYANALALRGCSVSIVHGACVYFDAPLRRRLRQRGVYIYRKVTDSYRPDSWFTVAPDVRILWMPSLDPCYVPDGDVVIATAWPTAEWASRYPAEKGKRYYLIQHWENWTGNEERLRATWKAPLKKIVIARWLQEIATNLGEESVYIPNGLDFSKFAVDIPIAERNSQSLAMLYHKLDWKGSDDGIRAILLVRERIPELQATLFGVSRRPPGLPSWIRYYSCPTQDNLRAIYNSSAIFTAPSWAEGWPLPPAEAMMCGAALAATDIGGHREYAVQDKTALLSPAKAPELLAENILRFIRDPDLRIRIAAQGNEWIRQFTWARAGDRMEVALTQDLRAT